MDSEEKLELIAQHIRHIKRVLEKILRIIFEK